MGAGSHERSPLGVTLGRAGWPGRHDQAVKDRACTLQAAPNAACPRQGRASARAGPRGSLPCPFPATLRATPRWRRGLARDLGERRCRGSCLARRCEDSRGGSMRRWASPSQGEGVKRAAGVDLAPGQWGSALGLMGTLCSCHPFQGRPRR